MMPWLVIECIDVKELRRDVRAVVVPLIGPIEGAGVHDGDGGGSDSMMYEDLCSRAAWEVLLLGVRAPLARSVRSSADDFLLSAGVSKTFWLMMGCS